MYSTTRKLALVSIILAAFNAFATVLFFLYFPNSGLGFAMIFTCILYLVTATVICLFISIGLRSLCWELNYEAESNAARLHELNKRVKELEKKVNY